MKETQLVDTLEVWEYSIKFNHNLDIDFPYDASFEIQVIGCLIILYSLVSELTP